MLIDAVGRRLAHGGFNALGVNTIAREAAVDKVLIYRYFGGLPGLLRAFGERGQFWPTDDELVGASPEALLAMTPAERWSVLLRNAIHAIRGRPITHEILAWEMVEENELTRILQDVREAQFERLLAAFGQDLASDEQREQLSVAVALSVAAANYLVARSRSTAIFAGLDLRLAVSWERIDGTVQRLLQVSLADDSNTTR